MTHPLLLSIAIAVYNGLEDLKKCLKSIYENPPSGKFEVIVVDDGSSEKIADFVRENYPQVKLIVNKKNIGQSGSRVKAMRAARGEYFLQLDADTIVKPGALKKLTQFMEYNPQAGVVGPKLLFPNGSFQPSFYYHWPTPVVVFNDYNFVLNRIWRRFFKQPVPNNCLRVKHLLGAALMVRKKVIDQVGTMDPEIAYFREETDWQYRIAKKNWEIWYVPEAVIIHKGGHSSVAKYIFAKETHLKGLWRFNHKHFSGWFYQLRFWLAVVSGSFISLILGLLMAPFGLFSKKVREVCRKIVSGFGFVLVWHFRNFGKLMKGKEL